MLLLGLFQTSFDFYSQIINDLFANYRQQEDERRRQEETRRRDEMNRRRQQQEEMYQQELYAQVVMPSCDSDTKLQLFPTLS